MPGLSSPMGAGSGAAASNPYLLQDTFTDTDGTLLVNHTPEVGGAWGSTSPNDFIINGNKLTHDSGSPYKVCYADAGKGDVDASIDMIPQGYWTTLYGLVVRYNPADGSGIFLAMRGDLNGFRLYNMQPNGGGYDEIVPNGAAYSITPGQTYPLRLIVTDSGIVALVNGNAIMTSTQAPYPAQTRCGVHVWFGDAGGWFANFEVKDVDR